jgi:inhibitor of KinA sporulation pathway (predicted exonuclease)
VVCDLEATCWRAAEDPELAGDQRAQAEIIEIGAVKLAPETYEILDVFSEFVRPVRHPILSDFCRELTHIAQADVAAADPFLPVWHRLCAWFGAPLEAVTFASWGAYDHAQLKRQTRAAGVPLPTWRPLNIKQTFAEWRRLHTGERTSLGLGAAIDHLGWTFEGTPHRAIDDARNTAKLLAHIQSPQNLGEHAWRVLTALARAEQPVALERLRRLHPGLRLSLGRTRRALLNAELVRAPEAGHLGITPAGRRALTALGAKHADADADRSTAP